MKIIVDNDWIYQVHVLLWREAHGASRVRFKLQQRLALGVKVYSCDGPTLASYLKT